MLEIFGTHKPTGWGVKWDYFTKFPASEIDIDEVRVRDFTIHTAKLTVNPNNPQELSEDLIKLAFIEDAFPEQLGRLIMPYFPGARADKAPFRGAHVYAHILETLLPNVELVVLDPHSIEAFANWGGELNVYDISTTVEEAVRRFTNHPYDAVIAPDKGAVNRAKGYADLAGIPCYYATKARDPHTGKLTKYDISAFGEELTEEGRYLVVDDICDGGGTFKSLANAIHEYRMIECLDLWITHGLFTGLASELPIYYDRIMTTNSVVPAQDIGQRVLNIDNIFWKEIATNV